MAEILPGDRTEIDSKHALEIAVLRQTEDLGELVVHFPRAHSRITRI